MASGDPRRGRRVGALLALSALALWLAWWWRTPSPADPGGADRSAADAAPDPSLSPSAPPAQARIEARLQLLVLDEAGYPVKGVPVRALDEEGRALASGISDNDGRLALQVPSPSAVELQGEGGWVVLTPEGPIEVRGFVASAQLAVLWPCWVDLEVLDPEGAPFVGARVSLLEHVGARRRTHPYAALDEAGRARRGLMRCQEATLLVRSPPGKLPRETWEVPVTLKPDVSLLIDLSELPPPPPPPPPAPRRWLSLDLDCVDCPSWLSCRASPDVVGLATFNESFCEGGPRQWRCDCPEAALTIWGTWLDPLTENGSGEPLGVVAAEVTEAQLTLSEDFASFEAQWAGPLPCDWTLRFGEQLVAYEDCQADGALGLDGLRPVPYTLELSWNEAADRARWGLDLAPGQDLDLGALSP